MKANISKIKPADIHHLSHLGALAKINKIEQLLVGEETPFDPAKDYYGNLRKTICKCLKRGHLQHLVHEVEALHFRHHNQRKAYLDLSSNLLSLIGDTMIGTASKITCRLLIEDLCVISVPSHICIEIGGKRWLIWFYFAEDELSLERIQIHLHLMKKLAPADVMPTIIDLRQEKVYQIDGSLNNIYEFLVVNELSFIEGYISTRSRYSAA